MGMYFIRSLATITLNNKGSLQEKMAHLFSLRERVRRCAKNKKNPSILLFLTLSRKMLEVFVLFNSPILSQQIGNYKSPKQAAPNTKIRFRGGE